jgi:hypothetical protein
MRFKFPDEGDAAEAQARKRALALMDAWWKVFEGSAGEIEGLFHRRNEFDLLGFMQQHLGAVDKRLMWEFGPAVQGTGHRLVITPEGERQLRPLVAALLDRAPTIRSWGFHPYRLADGCDLASSTIKGRTGHEIEGWRACASASEEGGVDLVFWARGLSEEEAQSLAFVASESLLGEEVLDKFIDVVGVATRPIEGAQDLGLEDLQGAVGALIAAQRSKLSGKPLYQETESARWSLFELKSEEAADYPHQADLVVAKTMHLPMWKRAHSNSVFASERFSRAGETFCYLKVDGSQGLEPGGFRDKADIEDALEAALAPEQLGAIIGGETGLRYSYVDLALVDVPRSIPVIRKAMQAGKAPQRTWLQFFDSDLAGEWVGIWKDSPAPPGVEPVPE